MFAILMELGGATGTRQLVTTVWMYFHLEGSPGVLCAMSPVLAGNLGKVLLPCPMLSAVVPCSIRKHLCIYM